MCLTGVYAYVDNTTVSGYDKADHDLKLKALLAVSEAENLSLNTNKCVFKKNQIDLLEYRVSHLKIQPDPERLRPLRELPMPKSKTELQRAIAMFSYYAKWLSDFSLKIKPFIESNKNYVFPLSNESARAFEMLKYKLAFSCLTCVNEGLSFAVEYDASNHTLSAGLNQGGRPIAFHSRTLSPSKRRYSAVEKEAAAVINAIRK